jgi:hypothetical protein
MAPNKKNADREGQSSLGARILAKGRRIHDKVSTIGETKFLSFGRRTPKSSRAPSSSESRAHTPNIGAEGTAVGLEGVVAQKTEVGDTALALNEVPTIRISGEMSRMSQSTAAQKTDKHDETYEPSEIPTKTPSVSSICIPGVVPGSSAAQKSDRKNEDTEPNGTQTQNPDAIP